MALSPEELEAIRAETSKISDDPTPPPGPDDPPIVRTLSNGLKVALVAGSILGAGFLLWRWREGSRADDDAKARELEAAATPGALPASAHCSCGPQMDPRLLGMLEAMAAERAREHQIIAAREAAIRRLA